MNTSSRKTRKLYEHIRMCAMKMVVDQREDTCEECVRSGRKLGFLFMETGGFGTQGEGRKWNL